MSGCFHADAPDSIREHRELITSAVWQEWATASGGGEKGVEARTAAKVEYRLARLQSVNGLGNATTEAEIGSFGHRAGFIGG